MVPALGRDHQPTLRRRLAGSPGLAPGTFGAVRHRRVPAMKKLLVAYSPPLVEY
jgi:hypothetical protein